MSFYHHLPRAEEQSSMALFLMEKWGCLCTSLSNLGPNTPLKNFCFLLESGNFKAIMYERRKMQVKLQLQPLKWCLESNWKSPKIILLFYKKGLSERHCCPLPVEMSWRQQVMFYMSPQVASLAVSSNLPVWNSH